MFFGTQSGGSKRGTRISEGLIAFSEQPNLDCNTYAFRTEEGKLAIVDPGNGLSFDALVDGMKKFGLSFIDVEWILVTHVHVDHVLGLYKALDFFTTHNAPCPEVIALGESARVLREADIAVMFPGALGLTPRSFGINPKKIDVTEVSNGAELDLGGVKMRVLETPGHAEGSMCLIIPKENALVSGDVVFSGGAFGRVDFPGGSAPLLLQSIQKLAQLEFEVLLPGHMHISKDGTQEVQRALRFAKQVL